MKKKIVLNALVLIVTSLFLIVKLNDGAETIEEAINTSGSNQVSVIHEEKNNKGSIVFS